MPETPLTRQTFGPHLRELRDARGLTITIAAKHAAVSRDTWRKWETGSIPQIWRAPKIARALNLSLAELLTPNPDAVHVSELTITREALKRIKREGTPELERAAAEITREATAKIETLARTAGEQKPPSAKPRPVTRPAWSVRKDLALRRLAMNAEREARELARSAA
jgi:DNA-binding XRE family transcriptional regulator